MNRIKIGISIGDLNGIGLEVILKAVSDKRLLASCLPVIYGSSKVISYHKNTVQLEDFPLTVVENADELDNNAVNVINCWNENVRIALGQITEEGGRYAWESLERATADWTAGKIDALVTAPIHKKAMELVGFPHKGHTEYLAQKAGCADSLMLLVQDELRVGLATNHIPISQVAGNITRDRVLHKIEMFYTTLIRDFGIVRPKLAVLGLNPHAGDGGALGSEDLSEILPAVQAAQEKGWTVLGPYAADGFFGSGNFRHFDGILAMYHDQGLVPFKTLAFGGGVNYTAGLPLVRTSPDHGTGFDIAGQNAASPDSFLRALFLACDVVQQRADYKEMTDNPLVRTTIEQSDEAIADSDDHQDKHKHHKHRRQPFRQSQPFQQQQRKPQVQQQQTDKNAGRQQQPPAPED